MGGLLGLVVRAEAGFVGEDFAGAGVVGVAADVGGAHEVDVGVDVVGDAGGVADEVAAGGAGDMFVRDGLSGGHCGL